MRASCLRNVGMCAHTTDCLGLCRSSLGEKRAAKTTDNPWFSDLTPRHQLTHAESLTTSCEFCTPFTHWGSLTFGKVRLTKK